MMDQMKEVKAVYCGVFKPNYLFKRYKSILMPEGLNYVNSDDL